jgi:hypothetical protein
VVKLRAPDRIDRMQTGFLNMLERFAGKGKLFHCRWCRLQFYDRRPLADPHKLAEAASIRAITPTPAPEHSTAEPKVSGPAS